jgi:hypothetical protein
MLICCLRKYKVQQLNVLKREARGRDIIYAAWLQLLAFYSLPRAQ